MAEPRSDAIPRDEGAVTPGEALDVRRAARGDTAAFERLYRRHVDRIYTLVRRMVGEGDADDVTQDIFVRAWEKLHTFRGESEFYTWLHRLAVNLTLSQRGSSARRRSRFPVPETLPVRAAPASAPGLRMDLERAVSALPDGAREIFLLHDVEGYKHHEIAELLDVSVGTSKSQLHRARMEMRKCLDR